MSSARSRMVHPRGGSSEMMRSGGAGGDLAGLWSTASVPPDAGCGPGLPIDGRGLSPPPGRDLPRQLGRAAVPDLIQNACSEYGNAATRWRTRRSSRSAAWPRLRKRSTASPGVTTSSTTHNGASGMSAMAASRLARCSAGRSGFKDRNPPRSGTARPAACAASYASIRLLRFRSHPGSRAEKSESTSTSRVSPLDESGASSRVTEDLPAHGARHDQDPADRHRTHAVALSLVAAG